MSERTPERGTSALSEARLLTHWATQIPAAIATRLVREAEDDSHSNLGWDATAGALLSHRLTEGPEEILGARVGVRFDPLAVLVVSSAGEEKHHALEGHTLTDSLASARVLLAALAADSPVSLPETPLRDYEMPQHAVARGDAFATREQAAELRELESWFASFSETFEALAGRLRTRSGVAAVSESRVWPHHFDLGLLVTLEASDSGPESIGIGMSPGDESFEQPYLYVSPYPWPDDDAPRERPLARGGVWTERGFEGALLLGDVLVEGGKAGWQDHALDFLESALAALRLPR